MKKKISIGFAVLAITMLASVYAIAMSVQSAAAIGDPGVRSAVQFAPGTVVIGDPGVRDAGDIAPSAYSDPKSVGDPSLIDDPTQRAPGLLALGEEFPGPE